MIVSDIIARAKAICDYTNTNAISADYALACVNEAYRSYYAMITSSDDDFFYTELTGTYSASIPLPADFYRLRSIEYTGDGSRWRPMPKYAIKDQGKYISTIVPYIAPRYRLQGDAIRIVPDDQPYMIRLGYYPTPETFDATDDISYPNGTLSDCIVYKIAVDFKRRMKEDYSTISENLALKEADLKTQLVRDDAEFEMIQDEYYWK